jgi:hypothetical protein
VDGKRRLPVLRPDGDDEPVRSPWQWVGFGAAAIFVAWLPLSALAVKVAARAGLGEQGSVDHARSGALVVASFCAALALGAILGGFLVGRWGGPGVGVREAALAGLVAAVVATMVSWVSFGPAPATLVVIAVAAPMAALGGTLGLRQRVRHP